MNEITTEVRAEIAKYIDREFGDDENLVSDLRLSSDDLSAIALALEAKFRVIIDRKRYLEVHTVNDYIRLISSIFPVGD